MRVMNSINYNESDELSINYNESDELSINYNESDALYNISSLYLLAI